MNRPEIEGAIEYMKLEKSLQIGSAKTRRIICKLNSDETQDVLAKNHEEIANYYDLAISALTQQLNNGWIPADTPPEENKLVLTYAMSVSRGSYIYTVGLLSQGRWFTESGIGMVSYPNGNNYDVLAWQPLPPEYRKDGAVNG